MQKLVEEYNYLDLKNVNGFKVYKFNAKKQGGAVVNNVLKNLTGLDFKTANIEQIEKAAQEKGLCIRLVYKYDSKAWGLGYDLVSTEEDYKENYNNIVYLIVNNAIDPLDPWQFDDDETAIKALDRLYYHDFKTLYRLKLGKWLDSHTFNTQKEVISLTKEEAEDWGEF